MPQSHMTPQRLQEQLKLLQQPQRLIAMAKRAREKAMPEAAQRVADICVDASGWKEAA
jgi:UDP-N-acetylglucosamine:LPS N-acetylglucosamine transferase